MHSNESSAAVTAHPIAKGDSVRYLGQNAHYGFIGTVQQKPGDDGIAHVEFREGRRTFIKLIPLANLERVELVTV